MADLHDLQAIKDVLTPIIDPDRQKSIIELDMVRDIAIKSNGVVSFTLLLNDPNSPKRDPLIQECKTAIKAISTVTDVWVKVIANSPAVATPTPPTNALQGIEGVKHILAISSGKGGVGKTFLTTTLDRYLIKLEGKRVGILDLDIDCPNIPVVFGVKDKHIANSEKKILPAVIDGIQIISTGLIVDEGKGLAFRGPILAKAIEQMINDSGFDNVEVLLIDMPPGTSDVFLTLVNAVAEAEFLLVTGTGLSAITDLGRVVDLLKKNKKEIVGVVENMVHAELEDSKKDEILKMGLEYITQIELKKIHREKKINDELKLVCKKIVDRLDPI